MSIRCFFGFHNYYTIRCFREGRQVGCERCSGVWGMHHPTKSFLKWDKELNDLHYPIENEEIRNKYYELMFAVGNKYKGETRHETALRYIRQAEEPKETDATKEVRGE